MQHLRFIRLGVAGLAICAAQTAAHVALAAQPAAASGTATMGAASAAGGATAASSATSATSAANAAAISGANAAAIRAAEEELSALLNKLLAPDASAERKLAMVKELEKLGADAVAPIHRRLELERRASPIGVSNTMKALREENEGRERGEGFDLVGALAKLKKTEAGYPTVLTTAALIRTLAHMGTTPALRELVALTDDHQGAFRPEITRQVKALGEAFVPALIEARRSPAEIRRWANLQLEALGKRTAGDAAQVKSSAVLCGVLRAYGNIHDVEALSVILSFVNSDRSQVRSAAREALANYGGDGLWKLREAYQNLTGKPTPDGWGADQVANELFLAYDRVRLKEVYDLLDTGLHKHREGRSLEAIADFDKVLAHEPLLDRRSEIIPAFMAAAEASWESDEPKALALYRKAARLNPDPERKNQIESRILTLEGLSLEHRGVHDQEVFKSALTQDPSNERARSAIERLEYDGDAKEERKRRIFAGVALLAVCFLGILVLGGRRRARIAPSET
jgi:tetratricopeptide (TPR) repeat protein